MGGVLLITFDKFYIELEIQGEGLFRYRIIENINIEECAQLYGYARDNPVSDNMILFCKLSEKCVKGCIGSKVISCTAEKTDMYPFKAAGLDDKRANRAADEKDLPEKLRINMDNGISLCFAGDDIEYFRIIIEPLSENTPENNR